jgi:hypothetical protein
MSGPDRRRLPPATLDMIGAEMVKLCRHVDALEKSVTRLAGRIDPFEDEKEPAGRPRIDFQIFKDQGATLDAVFSLLRQVDARIGAIALAAGNPSYSPLFGKHVRVGYRDDRDEDD